MFYRLLQFKNAIAPQVNPQNLDWAKRYLPPRAYALFLSQSPIEQQHALDVAKYLRRYRSQLTQPEFHLLIQAALLHDCGKNRVPIKLWHRVIIVVFGRLSSPIKKRLKNIPCFTLALTIAEEHPQWSSELAADAGLPEKVCLLIANHHLPSQDKLGQMLYLADNNN